MDIKNKLIGSAESLFDRHGFTATGMDRLTRAAGMSSRTLYKYASSKTALIVLVLTERDRRFLSRLDKVLNVNTLFQMLEDWVKSEGCRGCLFLRAHGETGGDIAEIADVVAAHKDGLKKKIEDIVRLETGAGDKTLTEQILILFEGATAVAAYRGVEAVASARVAAVALLEKARP